MAYRELKVLIACETSGEVREAFLRHGHDAFSCDILPADTPTNRHIQDDVRRVMHMDDWDLLMVAHPPCTRLCNSGVRWLNKAPSNPVADCTPEQVAAWPTLSDEQRLEIVWDHLEQGAQLFGDVLNAEHIPHRCIENPVMHKYAKARIDNYFEFTKSYHPWQFGHDPEGPDNVKKRTCLWMVNLPALTPTGTLDGKTARPDVHHASPGEDRGKLRSKFYPGFADAIADQLGTAAFAAACA